MLRQRLGFSDMIKYKVFYSSLSYFRTGRKQPTLEFFCLAEQKKKLRRISILLFISIDALWKWSDVHNGKKIGKKGGGQKSNLAPTIS